MRHRVSICLLECLLVALCSSYPACFQSGRRWDQNYMLDVKDGADTPSKCQAFCVEYPGCSHFTWYGNSQLNPQYPQVCYFFSSPPSMWECEGGSCVSGPSSCTCSESYSCGNSGDNQLEVLPSITTEEECQGKCYSSQGCEMYTWYGDQSHPFHQYCILYSSCDVKEDCVDCFTGPKECPWPPPPTTIAPTTSTTAVAPTTTVEPTTSTTTITPTTSTTTVEPTTSTTTIAPTTTMEPTTTTTTMAPTTGTKTMAPTTSTTTMAPTTSTTTIAPTTSRTTIAPTTSTTTMAPTTSTTTAAPTTSTTTMEPTTSTTTMTPTTTALSCSTPSSPLNGYWFCTTSLVTFTCDLECHPGYASESRTRITCSDGVWNHSSQDLACLPALALITGGQDPHSVLHAEVYGLGVHNVEPSLTELRESHTLDYVDGHVVLCGDFYTNNEKSCMEFKSMHWLKHSTLNVARKGHSSVVSRSTLYLLGGYSSQRSSEYNEPSENLDDNLWIQGQELVEKTFYSCAAKITPEVFIITGGQGNPQSAWQYNITSGVPTRLADMTHSRYSHGCVYVKDEANSGHVGIVVAGGAMNSALSSSEIYSLEQGVWMDLGDLNVARQGVRMVVIQENKVLAVGGGPGGNARHGTVESLNLNSGLWTLAEDMLEPRKYHAITAVPNNMFSFLNSTYL